MTTVALCEVCEERGAERVEGAWFCPQCCLTLCPACHHSHLHCPALAHHRPLDIRSAPLPAPRLGTKADLPIARGEATGAVLPGPPGPSVRPVRQHRPPGLPPQADPARGGPADQGGPQGQSPEAEGEGLRIRAHTDDITNDFKAMKTQLQDTFRDLHKALDKRQEDLAHQIQTQEQRTLDALKEAEEEQGGVTRLAACSLAKLTKAAPDDALATMTKSLTSLLKDAENMPDVTSTVRGRRLIFDDSKLAQFKSSVERLGEIKADEVLNTSSKRQVPVPGYEGYVVEVPDNLVRKEGAQLARILKVGHRVKRSSQWKSGNKDGGPGTVGTVVHVGAVTVLQGKVKVAWDSGASEWHSMGRDNVYELQLAM